MKRGIDVSTYQGSINWMDVRASGIDFAMIKATQGRSETQSYRDFTDSRFIANITEASSVGIRCGVYHYLTAQTVDESIREADYYLSVIKPYKKMVSLYAAVDVESKYLPSDKKLLTQILDAFCSRVEAGGYDSIIYTNPDWLNNRLNDVSKYPLWLALWRDKEIVPTKEQYPNLRIWQWGREVVAGIKGSVDSDFMIDEKSDDVSLTHKSETVVEPIKKDDTPSESVNDAVEWCIENNILPCDGNGDLMLTEPFTREQACIIAKRLYDKLVNDSAQIISEKIIFALSENIERK